MFLLAYYQNSFSTESNQTDAQTTYGQNSVKFEANNFSYKRKEKKRGIYALKALKSMKMFQLVYKQNICNRFKQNVFIRISQSSLKTNIK